MEAINSLEENFILNGDKNLEISSLNSQSSYFQKQKEIET